MMSKLSNSTFTYCKHTIHAFGLYLHFYVVLVTFTSIKRFALTAWPVTAILLQTDHHCICTIRLAYPRRTATHFAAFELVIKRILLGEWVGFGSLTLIQYNLAARKVCIEGELRAVLSCCPCSQEDDYGDCDSC